MFIWIFGFFDCEVITSSRILIFERLNQVYGNDIVKEVEIRFNVFADLKFIDEEPVASSWKFTKNLYKFGIINEINEIKSSILPCSLVMFDFIGYLIA